MQNNALQVVLGILVLALFGYAVYYYTVVSPARSETPQFGTELNFDARGTVGVDTSGPGQGTLFLIYEDETATATARELVLDAQSICAPSAGGVGIACMAMSVSFDMAFGSKQVRVQGIDNGTQVLVRQLEVQGDTPAGETVMLQTQIDQGASGLGVKVVPLEVLEDSRCPVDVQCVQAGTVRLRAQVISGMGTSTMTLELGMPVTTEAEFVTLERVLPEAVSTQEIEPGDYRFTFRVAKRTDLNI